MDFSYKNILEGEIDLGIEPLYIDPHNAYYDQVMKHDDIRILDRYIEYGDDKTDVFSGKKKKTLKCLTYLLDKKEQYHNRWERFVKVVMLCQVYNVPRELREKKALMVIMDEFLQSLWKNDTHFICIYNNNPNYDVERDENEKVGFQFIYGIQVEAQIRESSVKYGYDETTPEAYKITKTLKKIKKEAKRKFDGMVSALRAGFRQVYLSPLTIDDVESIRKNLDNATSLSVLRGVPKTHISAGSGVTTSLTGIDSSPESIEQNEEFIRGTLDERYIFTVLGEPIPQDLLTRWSDKVARELSMYKSQYSGSISHNAGISIPMIFAGNLSATMGNTHGVTDTVGDTTGVANGQSTNYTDSVSQNQGTSHNIGVSNGHTTGVSDSATQANTNSSSQGLTDTRSHSEGLGVSQSESRGVTDSTNHSVTNGRSHSVGSSESIGESNSISRSRSHSLSHSQSNGYSYGDSQGTSHGMSLGNTHGNSYGDSYTRGSSISHNTGTSIGDTAGHTYGIANSSSMGYSDSHSTSESNGTSVGRTTGSSISQTTGHTTGQTHGTTLSQTTGNTVSHSTGTAYGTSYTDGTTTGQSHSTGATHTVGDTTSNSRSNTTTNGTSSSYGTSHTTTTGYSDGTSHSTAHGSSYTNSAGKSNSYASAEAESRSHTETKSEGNSKGGNASAGIGIDVGGNFSVSENNSEGDTAGASKTKTYTNGTSNSASIGNTSTTTNGTSHTNNYSDAYGTTQTNGTSHSTSTGRTTGTSHSSSYGDTVTNGTSTSQSHSTGRSTTNSYTDGYSTSNTTGRSVSSSTSDSYSQSIGRTQSLSNSNTSSHTIGESYGSSISRSNGTTNSTANSNSHSVSNSLGNGFGTSTANGLSHSISDSTNLGRSLGHSNAVNHARTFSNGLSEGYSEGVTQGKSYSHSLGRSVSDGVSQSVSNGVGHSSSHSLSNGVTRSSSDGTSIGRSNTLSQGTSMGSGRSESQSMSKSMSDTYGTSDGRTTGNSTGRGTTRTLNESHSDSRGVSDARTASAGVGQGMNLSFGPTIGVSRGYQIFDESKGNLIKLLDAVNERMYRASRKGMYYVDAYLAYTNPQAQDKFALCAGSSWGGDNDISSLQCVTPWSYVQAHLLTHMSAFSPCSMTDMIDNGYEPYLWSSMLATDELAAISHLPRLTTGGANSTGVTIPPFTVKGDKAGTIYLGKQINFETGDAKFPFKFSKDEFMHTLIAGASGSGKTTTAVRMAREIIRNFPEMKIVSLDWKADWRVLLKFAPNKGHDFEYYGLDASSIRPIHINLLVPPAGVSLEAWKSKVNESLCLGYGFGNKMYGVIDKAFNTLFLLHGITRVDENGSRLYNYKMPDKNHEEIYDITIADLYQTIEGFKNKKLPSSKDFWVKYNILPSVAQDAITKDFGIEENSEKKGEGGTGMADAYDSILTKLTSFSTGELRMMYCAKDRRNMITFNDLLDGKRIIDLEGGSLDASTKKFVIQLIGNAFYYNAQARKDHEGKVQKRFFILEEAHEVIENPDGGNASPLGVTEDIYSRICNEGRSYGCWLMTICQTPTSLPKCFLSNSGILMFHRLADKDDLDAATTIDARNARLDNRDVPIFYTKMPKGVCTVKINNKIQHQDSEPYLIQVARCANEPPSNESLLVDLEDPVVPKEIWTKIRNHFLLSLDKIEEFL